MTRFLALVATTIAACAFPACADASPSELRRVTLRAAGVTTSLGTRFHRDLQYAAGHPVVGAGRVVVDAPGRWGDLVVDDTANVRRAYAPPRVDRAQAIAEALHGTHTRTLREPATATLAVDPARGGRLVWRVRIAARRPLASYEVLVEARTGIVVGVADRLRRATGQALVYDPNPVTALATTEGLADDDDADTPLLTSLRVPVTVERLASTDGCLTGQWVRALLLGGLPCAPDADFRSITRSDPRFEAVMAYVHVDRTRAYLETLGFTDLLRGTPMQVVADATDEANAYFDPFAHEIGLGTGGVDAGEDADAIVHEYGHAIQEDQVPGFGQSQEGGAIGEGFGDYLAAAMAANQAPSSPFTPCVAEWWATTFGVTCLRRVDLDLSVSQVGGGSECDLEVHCAGEAWSGALWDIRSELGGQAADRLIIQSQYALTASSGFADAAQALLATDRSLYGGAHQAFLRSLLGSRGFLDPERFDDVPAEATTLALPGRAEGSVDGTRDPHDVYALSLAGGQSVAIRLDGAAGNLDLRVFAPGSSSVDGPAGVVAASTGSGARELLSLAAPAAGTYYVDVFAASGGGSYLLETSPDGDGDGAPDLADNCPAIANPGQENRDGDDTGDACDAFPGDPANDADHDGLGADADNCPTVANASQSDWNRDGRGDDCDTAARVTLGRVRVVGRSLAVSGTVRPVSVAPAAWRVVVELRRCTRSGCRFVRVREARGARQAAAGSLTLRISVGRPGRYRLRAVLRDARFRAPASAPRLVTVR